MTAAAIGPASLSDRGHFGLWALAALAWFATIGWRPLMEPDEGRYAEIPREMWVSGDWVTPRLNAVKYFEKPALQYWATAAMYTVFGVREWTARFWPCALAFLCIPLTYAFARYLYGSTAVAGAAAAALAANPYFAIVGQINLLDSALTFFLVASMFAFLRAGNAVPGSREERRLMLITWLALGLAVLSKGIVALVLAGATLAIHAVITRDVRPLKRWHLGPGVPLFLLVTVPWFVVVSQRNPEFLQFFFIHEHFARYLTNVSDRVEPWWFFLGYALLAVLPWIAHVWPSMRSVLRAPVREPDNSIAWFLLVWCAFVLVFFSASHSKLPPYLMPMMPALAVLFAPRLAARPAAFSQAAWILGGLVALGAVGLCVAASRKSGAVPEAMLVWSTLAIAIAAVTVVIARRVRSSEQWRWVPTALGTVLAFQALMMSQSTLPPARTAKPLVASIRAFVGPNTEVFSVEQYRQSVPPYLGRTMRLVGYRGEMEFGLSRESAGFLPNLDAFFAEWILQRDAVAFVDPSVMDQLRARGMPMRVRGADARSVVVSRQ